MSQLPERRLAELRRSRVGFVFQAFNLMPAMTLAQNVELPGRLAGERPDRGWVLEALAAVDSEVRATRSFSRYPIPAAPSASRREAKAVHPAHQALAPLQVLPAALL